MEETSFASKKSCDLGTGSGIRAGENQLTLTAIEVEPSSNSE
jgi:hypothetical protein